MTGSLAGRVLDRRYRIDALLARGGMATVYIGTDLRLERQVALKVPHADLAADPAFTDRFLAEARAHARLHHPNIVGVFDQGEDEGVLYLVMEYVPGRTLRDLIEESQRLTPSQALAVVDAVLRALDAAHSAGFAHRDVKPENVLLGRADEIKVTDFGLARALDDGRSQTSVLGTAAYVSPEHIQGQPTDARSDVYACGILLYELVTGRPPYEADTSIAVAYRHVNEEVPRPSAVAAEIPSEIDDLVMGATRRDPAERFPSAASLLSAVVSVRALLPPPEPLPSHSDHRATVDLRRVGPAAWEQSPNDTAADFAGMAAAAATAAAIADATADDRASAQSQDLSPDWPAPSDPTPALNRGGPPEPSNDDGETAGEGGSGISGDDTNPLPKPAKKPRQRRPAVVATLVVTTVLALTGLLAWAALAGPLQRVTVPDLVGLDEQQALAALDEQDLSLEVEDRAYSETAPAGTIISQSPEAGSGSFVARPVTTVMSLGPERYAVPDVRGQTPERATSEIQDANMVVAGRQQVFDEQIAAGKVASTKPPAGQSRRPGTEVTLLMSKGPAPVPVPEVVGLSRSDAETTVESVGLLPTVEEKYSDSTPKDVVMDTDPPVGDVVEKGTTVRLTVSKGPPPVEVPNVVDMRRDDAIRLLEAKGFAVRVEEGILTPLNRVFGQDPGAGATLPRGSTVTIRVF